MFTQAMILPHLKDVWQTRDPRVSVEAQAQAQHPNPLLVTMTTPTGPEPWLETLPLAWPAPSPAHLQPGPLGRSGRRPPPPRTASARSRPGWTAAVVAARSPSGGPLRALWVAQAPSGLSSARPPRCPQPARPRAPRRSQPRPGVHRSPLPQPRPGAVGGPARPPPPRGRTGVPWHPPPGCLRTARSWARG